MPAFAFRRHGSARLARDRRDRSPDTAVAALPGEDTAASGERGRPLLMAPHPSHPLAVSTLQELRTQSFGPQRTPGEHAVAPCSADAKHSVANEPSRTQQSSRGGGFI